MRIRVYHGTRDADAILRDGFRPSSGGDFGPGIYLTENPDTAAFYALRVARGSDQPVVLSTTVELLRPYEVRKVDWIRMTERRTPRTVQRGLRRRGYDGILGIAINDYERQIVAFEADQIVGPTRVREILRRR